ncbi:phenylacetic acid degradation protein PaaN [Magnetospirillum sulfuroxidans]|uniref:Phenylacetic acid degradation protein PaaN n=1 Tax=Magnetospirillum sulfuroxidans TaxID=611300 RepID=A0ABS5IDP6_9PROT|nr:phenylacetic acid degradation protein PaaN [Magnetospirillum sulfuroxidans]MBR9972554.1 phenylacetic acid degradation protein PaaN [Magnetospirillum sulfuroxidans]
MSQDFFAKHEATLKGALDAIATRGFWSAYPEAPSGRLYGETAAVDGEAAFKARLDKPFGLNQPATKAMIGAEMSPFGFALGITYPSPDIDGLMQAAQAALPAWRKAGPQARAGVCLEILHRLNRRSFEIAHAVQHTTGQAFVMAFQAGGPHAQDRGLEAVAYGYRAMAEVPAHSHWQKPQGKADPLRMDKDYHIVGQGVALMVGCSTFPTWNGYPGLFASLVTGNAVVLKPHPGAILPLAITAEIARDVLAEAGLPEDVVLLATDSAEAPLTKELALRPEVKIIDFTGSSAFGSWLEANARQARTYAEKAGINFIVIESVADIKAVTRNLAFSLSLYSGQMCTTPQNIFVPKAGIKAGDGHLSFDEVAAAIAGAVGKFNADPERAVEVLGAVQAQATCDRLEQARSLGKVLLESRSITHPAFANARVRTPLILAVEAKDAAVFTKELFGPISFVIAAESGRSAIEQATRSAKEHGALTAGVYSTDPAFLAAAEDLCIDAGVALSENLDGGVFVNQSAAFSDYHGTGANPAANAALCDSAFVAERFRVVQVRRHSA